MKQRPLFVVCLIFGVAVLASAQARRVTNADLEKYRAERLKAEQDYRENYAKMGFPSPEELDRRREQSRIETERMSARLRADRLERERLEAEQRLRSDLAAPYYYNGRVEPGLQEPGFYYYFSTGRHRFSLNPSIYGSRPVPNRRLRPVFPAFDVNRRVRGPRR